MLETRKAILGAVKTLLIFAAAAVLISMLLLPVLRVQKGSMNPTLEDGEIVVFTTAGKIKRGDIIAFHYNNQVLIKRVIAIAGDRLDLNEDGTVILNGSPLYEPYVTEFAVGECTVTLPVAIPDGQFFVMGDHRATSVDSRRAEIGLVHQEHVVGKLFLRVWPINRFGSP